MSPGQTSTLSPTPPNGAALLLEGKVVEGSQLLAEALAQSETAELWNDWAVAQLMLAEKGFRRALEKEPAHAQAIANLAVLLFSIGKRAEAAVFLERSLAGAAGPVREHLQALLSLCENRKPEARFSNAERLEVLRQVQFVLEEYFLRGNRSEKIVTPSGYDPREDAQPAWIEETLNKGAVHDEDYWVFGAFRDPGTTILDVGAHFGYSATSIWSSGAASGVISLEANARFENCLRRLVQLRPGRYDYRITALGDSTGTLHFAMPLLNGYGIGALATANPSPNLPCLVQNIVEHWEKHGNGQPFTSLRIHMFDAPLMRLDDLLAAGGFGVPADHIVAIKIDTEGFEGQVLAGCPALLGTQKPLVLCEGGHSNPTVCRQLLHFGYTYARRHGKQLQILSSPAEGVNGFFLHVHHAQEYRRIGLLKA